MSDAKDRRNCRRIGVAERRISDTDKPQHPITNDQERRAAIGMRTEAAFKNQPLPSGVHEPHPPGPVAETNPIETAMACLTELTGMALTAQFRSVCIAPDDMSLERQGAFLDDCLDAIDAVVNDVPSKVIGALLDANVDRQDSRHRILSVREVGVLADAQEALEKAGR